MVFKGIFHIFTQETEESSGLPSRCIQHVSEVFMSSLFAGFIMDWKVGLRNVIHDRQFSLINQMFMQEKDIPA